MAIDINIFQGKNEIYTWKWKNGDFEKTISLITAIYQSVFCEKRATSSQVKTPLQRRGHFSNEFYVNYEVGSLFWLYTENTKNTAQNETLLRNVIQDGLQWLITDNLAKDILVTTQKTNSEITINIQLTNTNNGKRENYLFNTTV